MTHIKLHHPVQNSLVIVLNYSMLAVFAVTFSYWIWVFLKPSSLPSIPARSISSQDVLVSISAANWFSNESHPSIIGYTETPNLKLVGIFSSKSEHHGAAIFQLDNGKQQVTRLNNEVTPGVKLIAVTRNSATISQNGMISEIKLINTDSVAPISHTSAVNQANAGYVSPNNNINNASSAESSTSVESKPFNIQELIKKSNLGNR